VGDVVGPEVGLVVGRKVGLEVTGLSVGEDVGAGVGWEMVGLNVGGKTHICMSFPHGNTPFHP